MQIIPNGSRSQYTGIKTQHEIVQKPAPILSLDRFTMESYLIRRLPQKGGLFIHFPSQDSQEEYLPCAVTDIKVKGTIVDTVCRITLHQTFSNDDDDAANEALYRFPLYENSAVCGFEMEHSGRRFTGLAKSEEDAVNSYETAHAEGRTAALVLQKETDIFQIKLGNMPAKTSITIILTYITPLNQDTESNGVRFTLPTVIASRYGDPTNPGFTNVKTSETAFGLALDVEMPAQITSISSPSHSIVHICSSTTTARITYSNSSPVLDRDVVILINANELDIPRCMIEAHPTTHTKCAMLTLVPKFNIPRVPAEVIFIIDRSYSMNAKVRALREALQIFLKSLPASPEIYFNICSFGSHFDYLFEDGRSKKYDARTLKAAEEYVAKVNAIYGGTNLLDPLLDCMKKRRTDCPSTIILVTDGEVYDTESIIKSISTEKAKHLDRPFRVFSLGIGDSVSHHLVEGVARAGGGYSQFVMGQERFESKVVRMMLAGLQIPLNDLHVHWDGRPPAEEMMYKLVYEIGANDYIVVEKEEKESTSFFDKEVDDMEMMKSEPPPEPPKSTLKAPTIQQIPETMPYLYNGSRYVMYFLFPSTYRTPRNFTLKGTTPKGSVITLDIPVTESTLGGGSKSILHTLAARAILGELQEGRLDVHSKHASDDSLPDAVKDEGIRIGLHSQLMSQWTAFVLKDELPPQTSILPPQTSILPPQTSILITHPESSIVRGPREASTLTGLSAPSNDVDNTTGMKENLVSTSPLEEDTARKIVLHVSAVGKFPPTDTMSRLIGFADITDVTEKLPQALKAVSKEVAMTVLVCVFLETKWANEKEMWCMIVEKAWNYVIKAVGDGAIDELRKAAEKVIS